MRDVRIIKKADDLEYRIGLADVGEELITKTFALCCALHEAGNIDELYRRGNSLRRFRERR